MDIYCPVKQGVKTIYDVNQREIIATEQKALSYREHIIIENVLGQFKKMAPKCDIGLKH